MKRSRMISTAVLLLAAAASALAQGWTAPYDKAMKALKEEKWPEARTFFKQAISLRGDDSSKPTNLPGGSPTDPRVWRNGSPYSANFGAAYAGYKMSLKTADDAERDAILKDVAAELRAILAKGQHSRETYYVLGIVHNLRRDSDALVALNAQKKDMNWKVDSEILTTTETLSLYGEKVAVKEPAKEPVKEPAKEPVKEPVKEPAKEPVKEPVKNPTQDPDVQQKEPVKPTTQDPNKPVTEPAKKDDAKPVKPVKNPTADDAPPPKKDSGTPKANTTSTPGVAAPTGPVVAVNNKFALVIGNSTTGFAEGNLPYAASDAQLLGATLTEFAGYPADNVKVLTDVTAQDAFQAAEALAANVPDGGIVTIYYSGIAAHVDGKDYLAGSATKLATDTSTMIEKGALFRVFMARGAKIFSFFQVNRPKNGGKCFGDEEAVLGYISQMQATIPGGVVRSGVSGGKEVGLFTNAMAGVFKDFRSNRIPIQEFGWQVFDKIRGGGAGLIGAGATQVPTLPRLSNLALDARF